MSKKTQNPVKQRYSAGNSGVHMHRHACESRECVRLFSLENFSYDKLERRKGTWLSVLTSSVLLYMGIVKISVLAVIVLVDSHVCVLCLCMILGYMYCLANS